MPAISVRFPIVDCIRSATLTTSNSAEVFHGFLRKFFFLRFLYVTARQRSHKQVGKERLGFLGAFELFGVQLLLAEKA
jgi:hypothetical protein